MATVPDAYDVAVIITGDKDFMPAMQKTRLTGTVLFISLLILLYAFFCNGMLCHVILPCLTLPYLTLSYLILSYLILFYLTLSYLILPYLILPYLILPYLILSYLILSYKCYDMIVILSSVMLPHVIPLSHVRTKVLCTLR